MTIFFSLLLVLACLLSLWVISLIFSFHGSDAAGQGMARGFAFIGAMVLWAVLAGLLVAAGARADFSDVKALAAAVLFLAAVAGYFVALRMLDRLATGESFESLLRLIAVLLPLFAILYSSWNFFSGLRALLPERTINIAGAAIASVFSATPFLVMKPALAAMAARQRAIQDDWEAQQLLVKEAEALPADASLTAFLRYAYESPDRFSYIHSTAMARMKEIKTRQVEVEQLLAQGDYRLLADLGRLDLTVTPELCGGGRKCALIVAEKFKPSDPAPQIYTVDTFINPYIEGLKWLLDKGCDCKGEVTEIARIAQLYPPSYQREWLFGWLLEIQGKKAADAN